MSKIRNPLHLEIIPGILEKQWSEIERKIELVLPYAESIHIDVLDGKFAPNTTWLDPTPFTKYAKQVKLEAHLMVDDPLWYVKSFADAGFVRLIGQIEKMPDISAFVAESELYGEVGLAVDAETPVEKIEPFLEDIDVAFVMTVKAGFSNQKFLPENLEKVKKLREKEPLLAIEVDGGVNEETIVTAQKAGVTRFVSTGYLFDGDNNAAERYKKLKKLIE